MKCIICKQNTGNIFHFASEGGGVDTVPICVSCCKNILQLWIIRDQVSVREISKYTLYWASNKDKQRTTK